MPLAPWLVASIDQFVSDVMAMVFCSPVPANDSAVGDTDTENAASCVTLMVCVRPSIGAVIVIIPVRLLVDVLALTRAFTAPLFDPERPEGEIHEALLLTVHKLTFDVMLISFCSAALENDSSVGDTDKLLCAKLVMA